MQSIKFLFAFLLLALVPAGGAVAFDASSSIADLTGTNVNGSWTHTPTGTPRGVVVFIYSEEPTDFVTGVTYGGTSMTETSGSPNLKATTETMSVYAYFLGASVPTGAQTVQISVNGDGVANYFATAFTITAAADTVIQDVDGTINSSSSTNPSVTLSLGGLTSWCAIGFASGIAAPANITPLTNWTSTAEADFGAMTGGAYRYNTVSTADVTAGWTQAADDAVAITIAITESGGAPSTVLKDMIMRGLIPYPRTFISTESFWPWEAPSL